MTERKMARIVQVGEINPIVGADAIEVASVGGWKVVVKKGEYRTGDLAVYCEIDSWIPHDIAPFLSKGQVPREYNGVKGERLKTVRLRKQISQGLLLPRQIVLDKVAEIHLDMDVTELLGIQKWEAPIAANMVGIVRGNFPSFIPKTDQERVQNLVSEIQEWANSDDTDLAWEVTEKLDGSSMTVYLHDGVFGVCSRNIDLVETPDNIFWKTARSLDLENIMRNSLPFNYSSLAFQGELVGNGIQGNKYNMSGHQYYVYDIYDIAAGRYLTPIDRWVVCDALKLMHVPILSMRGPLTPEHDVSRILEWAEGKSKLAADVEREGIVFKNCADGSVSFKAISNKFLLSGGE
jgi:RNA ligase (TIGR02306 family)